MEGASFKKALRQRQELLGPDADPAEVGAAFVEVAESKTMRTLGKGLERTRALQASHDDQEIQKRTQPRPVERIIDMLFDAPKPLTRAEVKERRRLRRS